MDGLLKNILYKRVYRETVVKNGKKYRKYCKAPRINFKKLKVIIYLLFFMLISAALGAFLLYRSLSNPEEVKSPIHYQSQ